MASTFYGGIKLLKRDKGAKTGAAADAEPRGEMIYPLRQHVGADIEPLVKAGDKVKAGQKIADAEEYTAVPLHSSVSGTVSEVCAGEDGGYISIFPDRQNEIKEPEPTEDYTALNSTQLLWLIRESGAVDYDGVPVHMKLDPDKGISRLIINTCECEPYSASRYKRVTDYAEEFLEGINIIRFILGMKKTLIAAQTDRRDLIVKLKSLQGDNSNAAIMELADKYPQNDDRLMIKAVTGLELSKRQTPYDVGCAVIGAEAVYNIYRAIKEGAPVTDTLVTVSGENINRPGVYRAPIGISAAGLIELAGGHSKKPELIINGDIMTGREITDLKSSVTKTTACIISADREPEPAQYECIRCGRCADACPMCLVPSEIFKAAAADNRARISRLHAYMCTGCGVCEYVCPSKLPLTEIIANIANERYGD